MVRAIFWKAVVAILLFIPLLGAGAQAQANGPQLSFIPGTISTVAGNPSAGAGYSGDGGPATAAQLNSPGQISFDSSGNYYFPDVSNNVIRFVNIKTGNISTVAGGGTPCAQATDSVGDGCPATSATLVNPAGVTLDASGNLYIADTYDAAVRRVDATTGIITTVVGTPGTQCSSAPCGDGGPASSALLMNPRQVFFDPSGNMYVVDQSTSSVREVSVSTGIISTFAGTTGPGTYGSGGDGGPATSAQLWNPFAIAEDLAGNFYIADFSNDSIRKVDTTGTITTFVSGLSSPTGVSADLAGDILIADYGNNAVRKSDANGNLTTVAGMVGAPGGFGGDGGPATSAQLNSPYWVAADPQSNLYVADNGNFAVREVSVASTTLVVPGLIPAQTVVGPGNGQVVTVSNTGNATLQFTGLVVSSGFSQEPSGGTDCTSAETLAPQASCQIGIVFSPTQLGTTVPGTITISSNAGNATSGTNVVSLLGSALATSSTALTASASSIGGGQSVTFTATVTSTVAGTPTGTVSFMSGATVLATQTLSGGVATLTTNTLPSGAMSIVATYGGDINFAASTSAAVQLVVTPGVTTTSLTSSTTTPTPGQSVTFTAVVTSGSPVIPTGSINFMDGTVSLGGSPLDVTGTATFTTSSLLVGAHSITAVYSGDAIFGTSSSAAVGVTVSGLESPTVTLTVSNTSLTANQPATLQVSVGPTTFATPTGTVTFMNGTTTLGTGTLSSASTEIVLPYLPPGTDSITAVYSGDPNFSGATSAPVQVVVTGTPMALLSMSPPMALTAVGDITGKLSASPANYTGPVTGLVLTFPTGVVTDVFGNLYILDNGSNIWVVASGNGPIPTLPSVPSPQANTVYQVAGQGAGCASQIDSAGDGCLATQANFDAGSSPGLAIDSYGNLFIADHQNGMLRVIYANGAVLGLSNPVPGSIYQAGCTANGGFGGPCQQNLFDPQDSDLWVDPFENVYVADGNQITIDYSAGQIPALGPGLTSGVIYNISNNGYLAQSIVVDPLGNIYYGDDYDQVVQSIYTAGPLAGVSNPVVGQAYTFAGNGSLANGPENNVLATSAGVGTPGHLAVDSAGNVYIPDYTDGFVFKADTTGNLNTIFGTASPGCATATDSYGDGCLGPAASLSIPYSVALDPSGDLFIADNGANLVRELSAQTSQLTFGTQAVGTTSPVESVTITNPGAAPLTLSAITVSGQFAQAPSGGTDCSTTQNIPPGGSCQLGVVYAPTQSGSATGTVTLTSNANGTTSTNTIMLMGTTIAANNPVPTLTSLQPASAASGSGAFTLTVNGTNFVSGSVVNFNGNAETTTFVSATQVTAAIQASDIASVGTPAVTVTNPTPGGGTSNAVTFTISAANNPAPTMTSLQPASATAGSGAFTLTVNGTNFISGSVVTFNGNAETTTFVSATQVTAAIQASDITNAGATAVTVTNPAPGGGTSNALTFTINAAGSASTFTVSSSTSPQTVQPGGTAQYSVTVTAQNGTFSNPVTLTASGLPSGATATFSQPTVTPGGGSASSQLSIQTSSTTAALAVRGSGWVAAATLPFFGLFFLRRRNRRRWSTLAVLLLASLGAVAALSGCGAKKQTAQNYTITITGTSGAVAESTTVQLTVQ